MKNNISGSVYWHSLQDPGPPRVLSDEIKTSVAIVGGGMAGLSCAQKLHEAGCPVVLIERDFCGAGASGKTSGFITPDELKEKIGCCF